MSIASSDQEASTAAVTRSCFEKFQQCLQLTEGKTKIHVQTRLADLRLWADSVGAVAHEKASLDYRFQHRLDDMFFIRNLLSMLEGFLKDMEECFLTAKHEADLQDIMTNIDSTIETLAFIGVQIRRSGRKSRIRKADDSFDQNQDNYRDLRAHLACVVLARPTEEGRPKDEGKDINSVDYFAKMKLSPIQERLIEANLRRRHRFKEAQRHSGRLKDHSGNVAPPVIPQQFIAISTTEHAKQDVSPLQDKKIAAVMRQQLSRPGPKNEDTHTIAPTSASGLDSKWGGLQEKRRPRPTATRLTSTTAKMRYPQAYKLSNAEQKLAKCPCCCQAIPATELEGSRWRKHVANDLCPYTCVVANCPTPYNLFVTQEEWNDHVINDHPPHWQCPCCGDDPPIFKSISGITHHLMIEHPEVEADLEEFLSDAEISIMGITNCPLCDSEGPQDSLDLMEHVLQHVHDFSLRSLPWPADLPITLDKSAGLFDLSHAVKIVKDKQGNVFKQDIATWAEHVVPTFDQSRGVLICYDKEGKEFILSAPSTLEAVERWTSLQLRDMDRNTLKNEEESTQQDPSPQDYFSQSGNDYFVDESSDGRFSQTYHMPQQSGATERSTENHGPKRWICPMCHTQSKPESSGEKDFFEHLIPSHPMEQAEIDASGGRDRWMRYMLAEAYWLGIEVDSIGVVEGSEKDLDAEDPAALSSVGNLTDGPQYLEFQDSDSDWEDILNSKENPFREPRDIENTLGLHDEKKAEDDILSRLEQLLIEKQKARMEKDAAKKQHALEEARIAAAEAKKKGDEDKLAKLEELILAQKDEQLKREAAVEAQRAADKAEHDAKVAEHDAKVAEHDAKVAEHDAKVAEHDAKVAKEAADRKAQAEAAAQLLEAAKKAREEAEAKAAKEAEETKAAYEKALAEAKTAAKEAADKKAQAEAAAQLLEETKAAYEKALAEAKTAAKELEKAKKAREAAKLKLSNALKPPIKFKDAVGRKFSFPWHLCKTWKGMEELIKQAFLHVDIIGPHVDEGHYDLVGPDGDIILPQVWETRVQPDWSITMHMWPMPEPPPKEPGIFPIPAEMVYDPPPTKGGKGGKGKDKSKRMSMPEHIASVGPPPPPSPPPPSPPAPPVIPGAPPPPPGVQPLPAGPMPTGVVNVTPSASSSKPRPKRTPSGFMRWMVAGSNNRSQSVNRREPPT